MNASRVSVLLFCLYIFGGIMLTHIFSLPLPAPENQIEYDQHMPAVLAVLNALGRSVNEAMNELSKWLHYVVYMFLLTLSFYVLLWLTKRIGLYQLFFLCLITPLFCFIVLLFLGALLPSLVSDYYPVCFIFFALVATLSYWSGVFQYEQDR